MSTGTNKERIEQNNLKLEEIKNQVSNLPEYQDIQPIYDISDISVVKTTITWAMSSSEQVSNIDNIMLQKSRDASSKLYKLENGVYELFYDIKKSYAILIDYDDTYVYYITDFGSGYVYSVNLYRVKYDGTGNEMIKNFAVDSEFYCYIRNYGRGYFGYNNFYKIDIKNLAITNYGNVNGYQMNSSIHNNGNSIKNPFTSIKQNISNVNFVNDNCTKMVVNNDLYVMNSDLSKGDLIKQNFLDKSNLGLTDNYFCKYMGGKYYYVFPDINKMVSSNDSSNGYLIAFDEETNDISAERTLAGLKTPQSSSPFYKNTSTGYWEALTYSLDTNKILGYTYNGERLFYPFDNIANPAYVLTNKQLYDLYGNPVVGTMPNNGELNYTSSTEGQTIPSGYTSGGTISAVNASIDGNIIAENIKSGVTILGVTGTFEATTEVQEQVETLTQENETLTQENETLTTTVDESNAIAEDILGTTT